MRITESRIRRIIREELILEGKTTPQSFKSFIDNNLVLIRLTSSVHEWDEVADITKEAGDKLFWIDSDVSRGTIDDNAPPDKQLVGSAPISEEVVQKIFREYDPEIIDLYVSILPTLPSKMPKQYTFEKDRLSYEQGRKPRDDDEPEGPVGSHLQKFAFADQRDDVPDEKNTEFEERLFGSLLSHVAGNDSLSDNQSRTIKRYLEKGWYKNIFTPPSDDVVMRGMAVTREFLEKILRDRNLKKGMYEVNKVYRPYERLSSSWTNDKEVAAQFAYDNVNNKVENADIIIVLYAKPGDNPRKFISGPENYKLGTDGFYSLDRLEDFVSEQEIIGLGPIRISGIEIFDI